MSHRADKLLFKCFLVTLVLAPFLLGGKPVWAQSLCQILLSVISLCYLIHLIPHKTRLPPALTKASPVIALMILNALWLLIQSFSILPVEPGTLTHASSHLTYPADQSTIGVSTGIHQAKHLDGFRLLAMFCINLVTGQNQTTIASPVSLFVVCWGSTSHLRRTFNIGRL